MCKCSAIMYRRGKATKYWVNLIKINFSLLCPKEFSAIFGFTRNFEATPKNRHFLVFLAPASRRQKTSGHCLVCLKDNCQDFQKTPLEIMPGVSLPIFFMPKLKSFGVAPTSPTYSYRVSGSEPAGTVLVAFLLPPCHLPLLLVASRGLDVLRSFN